MPSIEFVSPNIGATSPEVSALVVSGLVGRYQHLVDGRPQYLSFHMTGDLPDAQTIFINEADTGLAVYNWGSDCGVYPAPAVGRRFPSAHRFAVWSETMIDAAISREAITNNSARTMVARMAHLFCELFYRVCQSHLSYGTKLDLPINRTQLGEALGMAVATVDRTLPQIPHQMLTVIQVLGD